MNQAHTRNFCIIAHIDHGKSTLADRMLELTGTVEKRAMQAQLLDSMDLEREKGITIKLQPVRMRWTPSMPGGESGADAEAINAAPAGVGKDDASREEVPQVRRPAALIGSEQPTYTLNLIDTPGHVDFSYEVSRSLAACEGAVLVVDASQGIQAQTLANVYLAIEAGLTIIPVLNKIDLPAADPERVAAEVSSLLGCDPDSILRVSGKTGAGVTELLDAIVAQIPAPQGEAEAPLRALIFDSIYDEYRGVILFVRVVDGALHKGDTLKLMATRATGLAVESGIFMPKQTPTAEIATGQIGYVVTNLKSIAEARVGDTVTLVAAPAVEALPGYRQVKPFVFAGFFPSSGEQYPDLKDALEKLKLNDAALLYEPESSQVLGFGYRVGFLGLLHLDIIKERLEREYGLDLVVTSPSTDYIVHETDGSERTIRSAAELPDASKIDYIREPWIGGEVVVPNEYVGGVIQLINRVRGRQSNLSYLDETLALVAFEAPLANVLTDFYDALKSITSGYGSFNYELGDYRRENLVRLDILVGGEMIDSLSLVIHRDEAYRAGKEIVDKLKEIIPKQLYEVSLQAAIGGKIIAREDVKAMRKDVTAKLYGGDVTRKNKLLDKQKKGKKRMKRIGKIDIPAEAFMVLVRKDG
ncbi:MAG TPA: translation elongation factor 4 [Candidatus Saccharimonadia bacterium]|nr:translation elongation factor 4 [Candidatus Saccharimonadia bacterium]